MIDQHCVFRERIFRRGGVDSVCTTRGRDRIFLQCSMLFNGVRVKLDRHEAASVLRMLRTSRNQ